MTELTTQTPNGPFCIIMEQMFNKIMTNLFRTPNGPLCIIMEQMLNKIMTNLFSRRTSQEEKKIKISIFDVMNSKQENFFTDTHLQEEENNRVMLTSIIEIVCVPLSFSSLILLECHAGRLQIIP